MPYISSANIACGYHAGDKAIMQRTIESALVHKVAIGAHPGFDDKANFGRTEMQLSLQEVYALVTKQIHILATLAAKCGTKLHHVKPHGALYNMSAKDAAIANAVAKAVFDFDKELVLFGLSGSYSLKEAKAMGLKIAAEVFADRTYQDDGSLTPRSQSNALITEENESLQQVLRMIQEGLVISVNGKQVPIDAETICIHGDGAHAVVFAKQIYHTLQTHSIGIKSI